MVEEEEVEEIVAEEEEVEKREEQRMPGEVQREKRDLDEGKETTAL